ncbi:hypothetical protein [Kingella oralis]|uniref:hypothetical protein n=1 Tax=Kingella oralis TaxID=505 RepID=UPI0034E5D193
MTQKHTQLTTQNLRIYKSQRLTDTDDGGGMMVSEALTGADNELFPPVSTLDNTMGGFDARLVYPAVLVRGTSTLLGANIIISKPAEAENVSVLLVKGDYYGQERASIMERMESYRTATTESRMTLLGKQRKGSRLVEAYQQQTAPLPVVGDVFALRLIIDGNEVYEFIRIASLSSELRTFEDEKGEFVRRVVSMTISQPLERDFEGMEDASRYKAAPKARVMQTQIADSASYYGIKAVAAPLKKGDGSLKVKSLYEQLVPVSTVETAVADDWAQGRAVWIETAPRRDVFSGLVSGGKLYLETPVLPTSVQIAGYTDDGQGSLKNGDSIINVDYVNGVLNNVPSNTITVSAIPAVQVRNYAYSAYINVNDTNVGREWAPLLRPRPARGSVQVSYRSGKAWYTLTDYGDYSLRDENGEVCGSITEGGSALISLPAMPDSPSQIVVSWIPRDYYQTISGSDAGSVIAPETLNAELVLPETPLPNLKPNSIKLTWAGGSAKDDGKGNLTGSCTGKVNYASGEIRPVGLTAATVQLTAQQYSSVANNRAVSVAVAGGSNQLSLVAEPLQKGSLKIALTLTRTTATGYTPRLNLFSAGK